MTYVLVSLLGDEATEINDAFARENNSGELKRIALRGSVGGRGMFNPRTVEDIMECLRVLA